MNELISILETAKQKHGGETPLTIGHLLNICKMAKDLKAHEQEIAAIKEEKQHNRIMSEISWGGQD
jgi:hypothetical protein